MVSSITYIILKYFFDKPCIFQFCIIPPHCKDITPSTQSVRISTSTISVLYMSKILQGVFLHQSRVFHEFVH
jgi:hypothetical protein